MLHAACDLADVPTSAIIAMDDQERTDVERILGMNSTDVDTLLESVDQKSLLEFVSLLKAYFVHDRIPAIIRRRGGGRLGGRSLLEVLQTEDIATIRDHFERLSSFVPES